mmetsp:Transcript_36869/g.83397  ORF Transcript_36869/g.83397 Transcript_36869/m.83397 type:complete len:205 (+) Transcript_36869:386-1000(+)
MASGLSMSCVRCNAHLLALARLLLQGRGFALVRCGRWQNWHSFWFWQPSTLVTKKHGLHLPSWWRVVVGSSAVPLAPPWPPLLFEMLVLLGCNTATPSGMSALRSVCSSMGPHTLCSVFTGVAGPPPPRTLCPGDTNSLSEVLVWSWAELDKLLEESDLRGLEGAAARRFSMTMVLFASSPETEAMAATVARLHTTPLGALGSR